MSDSVARFGQFLQVELAKVPNAATEPIYRSLTVIADALVRGTTADMERHAFERGRDRAAAGAQLNVVMSSFDQLRDGIWAQIEQFGATEQLGPAEIRQIEGVLHLHRNAFLSGFSEAYQQLQSDIVLQAEQIEAQRYTIRELSTPVLPLFPGVIAVPLVGAIDSYRATQVMERLLEAISEQQAEIVILDITGVPMVDTGVANYLLQAARAARLLGAQVVLVGIGAEIAQTVVQLGVDLSMIHVYANLQAGILYALEQLGLEVREIGASLSR